MANLVFKFSWDHRPFPYNSAQGKRQFMLPFASGIPNLAPAFSQITDIPTTNPASRLIGTSAGNVMEVGAFGLGGAAPAITKSATPLGRLFRIFADSSSTSIPDYVAGIDIPWAVGTEGWQLYCGTANSLDVGFRKFFQSSWGQTYRFRHTGNTTVDSNGFIKSASPVVKLFSDHIELNTDAEKQPIQFEKVEEGDYLLKGSLGFAQEGWYIEVPKDANGNTVVAVEYSTLENGDISIKTYKRKFDFELAAVVADHENPMDIPEGRWIDIRLHEEPEPEPEPEEPLSETPVDFQPTNLSQAVAAAMNGVEPPEISETDETL
ncbi:phage tail protein [Acinetobacter baumannii]|uniref:phage tail fiber protein n=2 Tax=Acinetobacter baumannii TaxID=470 RepID=UPI000D657B17|nr:phage tail protein [Acinetobacter baumannii]MDB0077574.1 phage tail protein [Acinetobacter baumannii]